MTAWIEGTVVGQTRWTERLLSLKVDAPMGSFEAGQFAKLALDVDGERIARPYSFVNAPGAGPLEFYYAVVPGGPLSPRLAALAAGDRVYIAANPAGFLVLSEVPDAQCLWLVSTGTGIGPFLSILRTEAPWKRFPRVVLVHAARHLPELVYPDVIAGIAQSHPAQFSYVRVASRETGKDAARDLLHGRIPVLIRDGSLEARAGCEISAQGAQVMLCGNPEMVKDATAALAERGMKKHRRRDPGQITVENYW
ncbi:MAG: ferredoxin--NADP reductase [Proteobacteria bacterium]|nr:ferredoxin--NADP reductase [Pseudomonadota bacterium]